MSAVQDSLPGVPEAPRSTVGQEAPHTVTLEWDKDGYLRSTLNCPDAPESLCHAVYNCDCEEYGAEGVADGRPWHSPYAYDEAPSLVRHRGVFDPAVCNLRDWFDNEDDPIVTSSITVPVKPVWTGDGYEFHLTNEADS